jgi:hypothetical protein
MKKLSIGIQSFEKMRTDNYTYVDKTPFVKKFEGGGYFFLSRPRRFGKSLFLDTLRQAFLGKRELFEGLYLQDNWDWDKKYPVISISFGKGVHRTPEDLKLSIEEIFLDIQKEYQITLSYPTFKGKFQEAIKTLYEKYQEKVVVLVDEYDKPILDRIEEPEIARENREILKDFYSVLKDTDIYLKLVFLTGVSRFSKVSIFSGLNQLQDITLNPEYATICGYTQWELESVFEDRLAAFDKEEVKNWYNGYNWLGESVYNPFDILLLFSKNIFRSYWFETGTPTFLIKLFQRNKYYLPKLEELKVGEELLSNIDIDYIFPENLLFQSGYLTIKDVTRAGSKNVYLLTYPNLEVRMSFTDAFLTYLTPSPVVKDGAEIELIEALQESNVEKIKGILYSFFASIPSDWYRKNELQDYEGYYASVIYALFNGAGLRTIAEDATNTGRIDLTVLWESNAYVVEFKVVEDKADGNALSQIKEKRYFEKYVNKYSSVYLIGIEFSKKDRNIVSFDWERL